MKEFEIIDRYFKQFSKDLDPHIKIAIGDDSASIDIPSLMQHANNLLITTDTLVENTHFLSTQPPASIGYKSLAVNLSDIAAMGGTPKWVLLNLTLPNYNEQWLQEFSHGFAELISLHNLTLIGGDTTQVKNNGPISISITVLGLSAQDNMSRTGAVIDDGIFITGNLGEPCYVLDRLLSNQDVRDRNKLYYPLPRVQAGQFVNTYATSAIDLSDGLLADLGHILKQSNKAAVIDANKLPVAELLMNNQDAILREKYYKYVLAGGDEYEILFTAPMKFKSILEEHTPAKVTQIGVIKDKHILDANKHYNNIIIENLDIKLDNLGWEHFG